MVSPSGLPLRRHEREAGVEVVDEVDRLLALLLVDHRGEREVVAAGLEPADDAVEVGVLELELHAEHLAERLAEVGVEAEHGLVVGVEELHRREADARRDPHDPGLLDVGRQHVGDLVVLLERRDLRVGRRVVAQPDWLLVGGGAVRR